MVLQASLVFVPVLLLVFFLFFAAYNYAHAVGVILPGRRPPVAAYRPDARVAVVIVSFNERTVIADTVRACEQLSYPNRTIVVGDDSNDPETIELLRRLAAERGCTLVPGATYRGFDIELWESDAFVVFHRSDNAGFKAGNLKTLEGYLLARGFGYMYLLDSDWRPQVNALERCLETIAADPAIAYVQAKRMYHFGRGDHFQRCLAINEEACYLVDLPGRQRLGQMILFTGCCTLFDLGALRAVGGFLPGHLTEDIDLSNRFYLAGYRGVYIEDVSNVGEVPPNYRAFRRQQERWAIGSARAFKEYLLPVLRSELPLATKLSLLRQNSYYTVALGVEVSLVWSALAVALTAPQIAPGWLMGGLSVLLLVALFSNVLPLLVSVVKKREWMSLLYVPFACWIALSVVHTYAVANLKGFRNVAQSWFVTPKTNRQRGVAKVRAARLMRAANVVTLAALTLTYLAAYHASAGPAELALIGGYAALWVPSLVIAAVKS